MSDTAIVNLINGLFGRDFPADSTVTYYNRDFIRSDLHGRYADIFATIGGEHMFHLEAQTKKDRLIALRVFEYSFQFATSVREASFDPEKFSRLQDEIRHDILGSIDTNLKAGCITEDDARQLLELTNLLDEHIRRDFTKYMKGAKDHMKPLLPGAIELPNDKYRFRIDKLEKQNAIYAAENARYADENARYADENARYADEILQLKKRITELEAKQYPN